MAITKTLSFTGLNINGVSYSTHLTESGEITIEEQVDEVDDKQSLVSAYDVSFSAKLYDSNVAVDSNVYTNTAQSPSKVNVAFTGVTGGQTVSITGVIVNGTKDYDENRTAIRVFGSKRVTSLTAATTDTTAS
jgi:hypothetical protein